MAEYTVDNLAIEIEATADKGIQAFDLLIAKATKTNTALLTMSTRIGNVNQGFQSMVNSMNGMTHSSGRVVNTMNKIKDSTSGANQQVKQLKNSMVGLNKTTSVGINVEATNTDGLTKSTEKMASNMNAMFSVSKAIIFAKVATNAIKSVIAPAVELTENFNLFSVAMGKSTDEAMVFQQTLNSALGVNLSDSLRYQGFFQALATNLGIASDSATLMSESLTKLTYDLSSLYNMDVDTVYGKLQSGMVGMTKPLRELGVDVTAQTLQQYINDFGWEVQIQELPQAEKVLLRYIAAIEQTKLAQGNLAQTIETPSNQFRIFKELVAEASAWLGTAFLGAVSKVMVYVNGLLMVIKELAKAFATLLGFNLGDFNFGTSQTAVDLSGLEDMETGLDNVSSGIDKAKNKMKGLQGFNEINNIQTPTESSAGSVGGSMGNMSYYDELTEKLKGYDNLMSGVSTKAKEFRDYLFDLLGISFDEELGILNWNFFDMNKGVQLLVATLGGLLALKVVGTIVGWITTAAKMYKIIATLIAGVKAFGLSFTATATLASVTGTTYGVMATKLASLALMIPKVAIVVGALALAFRTFKELSKPSIESMDIFGDVSEATKKKLEPFMETYDKMSNTIKRLDWADSIITQKDVDIIGGNIDSLTTMMNNELTSDLEEIQSKLEKEDYFRGLDPLARQGLLEQIQSSYATMEQENNDNAERMKAIYQRASDEHRALTNEEQKEVNAIQERMLNNGIKALTENEKEQDTILRNIKNNAIVKSAEQASAIVKDSLETKKKLIKDAEERYADEMRIADQLWERGDITKDQYDELVRTAKQGYDDTLKEAEGNHEKILEEAKKHSGKYLNHINWETGEVKTFFELHRDNALKIFGDLLRNIGNIFKNIGEALANFGRTVGTWFAEKVAPWFTKEKWLELGVKAGEGLRGMINGVGAICSDIGTNISTWFTNSVKPWFTAEKWGGIISDALDGFKKKLSSKWSEITNWFGNNLKLPKITFPSFNIPKFSVGGGSWNPIDWVQGKGIPKIDIQWVKAFATGGFPKDEDGMFMANSSELVGKFSNGKTAVANNNQIISGIQRGVTEAIKPLINNDSTNNAPRYMETTINIEGGTKLGKVLIDLIDGAIVEGGIEPKAF